eukprot:31310-Pelagococcus_subviridis.AAC.3
MPPPRAVRETPRVQHPGRPPQVVRVAADRAEAVLELEARVRVRERHGGDLRVDRGVLRLRDILRVVLQRRRRHARRQRGDPRREGRVVAARALFEEAHRHARGPRHRGAVFVLGGGVVRVDDARRATSRILRILRILLLLLREDEVPREREHDLVRGEVPQRDEAAPAAVAEVSERHLALERRVVRGPREPAEDARRGVVGRVVGPGRRPDAAARRRRRRRAGRRRARRRARSRRDARWRRRHRRAHASGSARARPGSDRETDLKTHTHTI